MRQTCDQVEADIGKTCLSRSVNQSPRVFRRVQPSDGAQLTIIKRLRADAEAIDTERPRLCQVVLIR